ncbi:succinylglutamate desuccinylase/aspartoacylase family protein [Georgenia sp. MJ170]|uniref:succinylglutamate desuccinylase/aspartoacylase family protein n=1 Tax=Georgenia sunbinii TaxID=3117728 RepID=UPI002F25FA1F
MTSGDETSVVPGVIEVGGHAPGPVVAVLGGVHGDELEGVLAARVIIDRLRALAPGRLRGTVRVAAPAHPAAWEAGTRTSPIDGLNLARVFPGSADGSPTEQVAAHLTERVIAGADLLIDLHSAGLGFDMPLMVGYHTGPDPVCVRSAEAAEVFGAPFRWEHPHSVPGRSLSAAAALGVPSIYVEGRGGGQVRRRELDCYVDGVLRVLHLLGVVDDGPAPALEPEVVRGDGNTDGGVEATVAGFFVTSAGVGEQVTAGQVLGEVVDERGQVLATVTSPRGGIVMLTRRHAAVTAGDTLAIVAEKVGGTR